MAVPGGIGASCAVALWLCAVSAANTVVVMPQSLVILHIFHPLDRLSFRWEIARMRAMYALPEAGRWCSGGCSQTKRGGALALGARGACAEGHWCDAGRSPSAIRLGARSMPEAAVIRPAALWWALAHAGQACEPGLAGPSRSAGGVWSGDPRA